MHKSKRHPGAVISPNHNLLIISALKYNASADALGTLLFAHSVTIA
jgi:hypothetical protein